MNRGRWIVSKTRYWIGNVSAGTCCICFVMFFCSIFISLSALTLQDKISKTFDIHCGVHLQLAADATDVSEAKAHAQDAMAYVMTHDLHLKNKESADWLRELQDVTNNIEEGNECDRGTFDNFRSFVSAAPPSELTKDTKFLESIQAWCFITLGLSILIGIFAYSIAECCISSYDYY